MKLIIASNNAHKIKEIKEILGNSFDTIVSLRESGIDHETVEDGKTFMENAVKKAREIAKISGCPALADDSGIAAHALGDEPGIFSARYAGVHGDDEANNSLLISRLEDKEDKGAHYTCAMALAYPDGKLITAEGYMYGAITKDRRGTHGFGYDPYFVPDGEMRTVAEMSDEEKNTISHRSAALKLLLERLGSSQKEIFTSMGACHEKNS